MLLPRTTPVPGEKLLRFVGDRLRVTLTRPDDATPAFRAFLRTNLTRAAVARAEVIALEGLRTEQSATFAGASWRDIPLHETEHGWEIDLPLLEVGHFYVKPYCVDEARRQRWPEGRDVGISVHPDHLRTGNLIYCAFARTLGRAEERQIPGTLLDAVHALDQRGFNVIPPSGTLRSLTRALPHIFDTLGCRVLHLLPIGPVPTTYARMGRYGSPYAQLDLTEIDPALVELDKRTTAVDQFRELTDGVHLRAGLVILDIVLNHTGWGSRLLNAHPEWFRRHADGTFHSPGAWGTVWADLVELDQSQPELWDVLADSLITWCRRGVDGFRCDAGYMIPLRAWQYIVARVRQEFPECVFLLEGLGGAWDATETLLTDGGMQWAYSELFQCYSPEHVAHYLDHANHHSERIGVLVHYSETHDNDRLAKKGTRWSLMRNRLSALSSHVGAFGFAAGVEWLCAEKFDVHEARSLGFGHEPNLVAELARLSGLLRDHPCFFDGAHIERVSPAQSPVLALKRLSREGSDMCLVLINLDVDHEHELVLSEDVWGRGGSELVDLLGQKAPAAEWLPPNSVRVLLAPGMSYCLAPSEEPVGLSGDRYRVRRAQASWAYVQLGKVLPHEALGHAPFEQLGELVARDPEAFLSSLASLDAAETRADLLAALENASARAGYPRVVLLYPEDARRVTLVPPGHWLLVRDTLPFELDLDRGEEVLRLRSVPVDDGHIAAIAPHEGHYEQDVTIRLERFGDAAHPVTAHLRRLATTPTVRADVHEGVLLLTNGRGGMVRMHTDLGRIDSKYDCVLGANLHPDTPSDRHVFVKRLRAWVNADGFITPLSAHNLVSVEHTGSAALLFAANGGDGRRVGIRFTIEMLHEQNTVVVRLERLSTASIDLPPDRAVTVTIRLCLEDRNFHQETHADDALRAHFEHSVSATSDGRGFVFAPAKERGLIARTDRGVYHPANEWSYGIAHGEDRARGIGSHSDVLSPGWFELPLVCDDTVTLTISAEHGEQEKHAPKVSEAHREFVRADSRFESTLRRAALSFVVRRGKGRSVIAGYPWFLDWGRDTLIAARGYLAAGLAEEVREIVRTYAGLERHGTLPNLLSADGAVSRETSDAPLFLGLVSEELAQKLGDGIYDMDVGGGRTLLDVLTSIATHHVSGAENGVIVDRTSGLVFSPPHYTWMDTNYPAATPREGYPIELSALWIRLLRQLVRAGARPVDLDLAALADRAEESLTRFYRPELGYAADTLHAPRGTPANEARPDDHLRPNQLLAVTLGLFSGAHARSMCRAVERHLLVPGALRSLAPLRVAYGLPVRGKHGEALNDPSSPYWGHYEGDEDTRRKPAYHNGTAWVWWLPSYAEALVAAYPGDLTARSTAISVLGSTSRLLAEGNIGQLPEIIDGDAPHRQRGCDAQAWSATETLRVWLKLREE